MILINERELALVEFTIKRTLESIGFIQPERISQNQAYKKYGEGRVKKWERDCKRRGKQLFERRGTSRNSTKSALVEDLDRIYKDEKRIALKIKQS